MSKFWVLVCILSLISCVNKQEEDYIVAVEEITFPGVKGYVESYYYDSLENKEYLSFFTIRSVEDSLKVFEFPTAKFLYSVPMYALWDTLNGLPMRSFKMIGVDTFCISAEENIFVFLNKQGHVYKWLDMNPYSKWRNVKLYYKYDFLNPVQNSTKNLFFKIGAEPNDTIGSNLSNELDRVIEQEFARESAPNFCRVRMDADSVTDIEHFLPDIRNYIFGKGNNLAMGVYEPQIPVNDKYYFASAHLDTVYEFNRLSRKILNKYKISSKYTKIGYEPCKFKEVGTSGMALQKCSDEKIIMDGYIRSIHFMPEKKRFVLEVRHTHSKDEFEVPSVKNKSASIMVLTDKFEVLAEKKFNPLEYIIAPDYTKDGFIFIKRPNVKAKIKDENYTYQYFIVN